MDVSTAPAFLRGGSASTAVFAFPSADCHGPDVWRSCCVHEGHHEAQQPGGSRERDVLCRFTRAGYEDGEKILVHPLGDWQSRWNDPLTTCHFSFAHAAAFSSDPENVRQVAMLDEELPAAQFAPTLGTLHPGRGNWPPPTKKRFVR